MPQACFAPSHKTLLVRIPAQDEQTLRPRFKINRHSQKKIFIRDEIPQIENAKVFDIDKHSFNPLQNIGYEHVRERKCSLLSGTAGFEPPQVSQVKPVIDRLGLRFD